MSSCRDAPSTILCETMPTLRTMPSPRLTRIFNFQLTRRGGKERGYFLVSLVTSLAWRRSPSLSTTYENRGKTNELPRRHKQLPTTSLHQTAAGNVESSHRQSHPSSAASGLQTRTRSRPTDRGADQSPIHRSDQKKHQMVPMADGMDKRCYRDLVRYHI